MSQPKRLKNRWVILRFQLLFGSRCFHVFTSHEAPNPVALLLAQDKKTPLTAEEQREFAQLQGEFDLKKSSFGHSQLQTKWISQLQGKFDIEQGANLSELNPRFEGFKAFG